MTRLRLIRFVGLAMLRLKSKHRLLCGDSTDKADVDRLMDGARADMVFTSPPYGIGSDSLRGGHKNPERLYKDHDDDDKNLAFHTSKKTIENVLDRSAVVFWNIQLGSRNKEWFWQSLPLEKLCDVAVWTKTNPPPGSFKGVLTSAFEFVFIFSNEANPTSRKIPGADFPGHKLSTVYNSSVARMDHGHKAAFSLEMVLHFVEPMQPNLVLEPFCGSGSTLIACEKTNRTCYGLEIDPHYCSVILKRYQDYSGGQVVKT